MSRGRSMQANTFNFYAPRSLDHGGVGLHAVILWSSRFNFETYRLVHLVGQFNFSFDVLPYHHCSKERQRSFEKHVCSPRQSSPKWTRARQTKLTAKTKLPLLLPERPQRLNLEIRLSRHTVRLRCGSITQLRHVIRSCASVFTKSRLVSCLA